LVDLEGTKCVVSVLAIVEGLGGYLVGLEETKSTVAVAVVVAAENLGGYLEHRKDIVVVLGIVVLGIVVLGTVVLGIVVVYNMAQEVGEDNC